MHFSVFSLILASLIANCSSMGAEWEKGMGFRRKDLFVAQGPKPGFTLIAPAAAGINWTNSVPPEKYTERANLTLGSGLALGDYDNDGLCDIFFCNKFGPSALYRNLGNWKFQDVSVQAGAACTNQISNGAVFADVNGDGFLDLLVTSFTGPNALLINNRNGTFTNLTSASGLFSKGGATSQALADLDGDGFLDLYVQYFGIDSIFHDIGRVSTRMVNGKPTFMGRFAKRLQMIDGMVMEVGEPDMIYHNDGKGHFLPIAWEDLFLDESGKPMAPQPDFGLAIQIRDINGDGLPDIYLCNDFQTPDRCWLNDGSGRFRPIDPLAIRGMSYASMGVDFGDLDHDGNLDYFTLEMLSRDHSRHLSHSSPMDGLKRYQTVTTRRAEVPRNVLAWNRGDGTYADIAWYSGVAASDWSWTPIFLDVDLDGFEDILISNGHLHDETVRDLKLDPAEAARLPQSVLRKRLLAYPPLDTSKVAFRNRGNMTFEDASDAWNFNSTVIAHGMAAADLDNDGDLDIVMSCVNAPPLIYRNESPAPRIAVRLKGKAPNTFGIGAKILLHGARFTQMQEMICGGRYLSSDDLIRVFAASDLGQKPELEVIWRNGSRSIVSGIKPNSLYEVSEEAAVPQAKSESPQSAKMSAPLFEDVSDRLKHVHQESLYDDFARQNLLPKALSHLGPGISWFDFNGDGAEDLMIGAGKGGKISFFQNDGSGQFTPIKTESKPLPDDSTTLLGRREGDQFLLLTGLALWERTATNDLTLTETPFGSDVPAGLSQMNNSSTGPLALADIDGDGDLDLFVGGRFIPGQYPRPASSTLYWNDQGKFTKATQASELLASAGLVSSAVFSDLDNDGLPELILACEWGPIRVFKIRDKALHEMTSELGFNNRLGLWSSVTTGDFDGDGRMDIVAGNWGLNSFYNTGPEGPWFLYYGDFNGDNIVSMIEAYSNRVMRAVVPFRSMPELAAGNSWLTERFTSHDAYSKASVQQILGERAARSTELQANTLASAIFWNRGGHFEAQPLPAQAQWSPAFGLNVADFDGDGREDLFIAQNFFSVRPDDERLDAGRGLLLRGTPDGFVAMPGQDSGLKIYHEQRGSAAADFDGDGRVDLCVSQNAAETKLYKNVKAEPGLRVRLAGPPANPAGYGTVLRIRQDGKMGPAREIHCGSGYWSQDAAVQVFAVHGKDPAISARWPGGKEVLATIPPNVKEISLDQDGAVKVIR